MQRFNYLTSMQMLVLLLFALLITLSPSIHFLPYIEFHDCQRILQLLLLGMVLISSGSVLLKEQRSLVINTKLRFVFFGLLGLAATSVYLSTDVLRYAVIEWSLFFSLAMLSLFIAQVFSDNKQAFIKTLTYIFWASILLYMLSFYVGYTTALIFKKKLVWPYPFFGFSNIRFFQQYQLGAYGLICLPLLAAFNLKKNHRFIIYTALSFWSVLLFYAASRGVWLSWLVAMLATAIIYQKQAWPFLRVQLTSMAAGFAGYLLLFKAIPIWTAPSAAADAATESSAAIVTSSILRSTTSDRLDLWKAAYEMIGNAPFFGVGPMQYAFNIPFGTYPHNSLLLLASEWGLLATSTILAIAIYSFYCWFKKFNPAQLKTVSPLDQQLAIVLFFSIIANSAYSLVSGVIVIPISQVLFFTTIGLMIGQYIVLKPQRPHEISSRKKSYFRPAFALVALLAMSWSIAPEFKRGITSYNRNIGIHDRPFALMPGTINPRIWMQQRPIKQLKKRRQMESKARKRK